MKPKMKKALDLVAQSTNEEPTGRLAYLALPRDPDWQYWHIDIAIMYEAKRWDEGKEWKWLGKWRFQADTNSREDEYSRARVAKTGIWPCRDTKYTSGWYGGRHWEVSEIDIERAYPCMAFGHALWGAMVEVNEEYHLTSAYDEPTAAIAAMNRLGFVSLERIPDNERTGLPYYAYYRESRKYTSYK